MKTEKEIRKELRIFRKSLETFWDESDYGKEKALAWVLSKKNKPLE